MYFDFEENRPDTPTLAQPMSWREVVLVTVNLHLLAVVLILIGPRLPFMRAFEERRQAELHKLEQQQQQRDNRQFVFVQPRLDMATPTPRPRADLSDLDRRARTVEKAPKPRNTMPFARGNSPERIEAAPPAETRRAPDPSPPASRPAPPAPQPDPTPPGLALPTAPNGVQPRAAENARQQPSQPAVGVLGDAIRNVQKYAERESFVNAEGGGDQDFAPAIQFDTKGVEFGPWLRRFIAQIRRNWMVPLAAMTMKGHVVVTFYVHKDGSITAVGVAKPSGVDSFNRSAANAILASNPTQPLPPEYPDPEAFFTVTFYFNETPSGPSVPQAP